MEPDDTLSEAFNKAIEPYIQAIEFEREQSKYWYESSIRISKEYNDLLERNYKLREENRKLYMRSLGLKD